MLRKACSAAYQLASRPHARHLISIERPELGQLCSTGLRGTPACPTSGGTKTRTPACNFSMTASHGSSLDDMDNTMMEIRGRLASIESAQQEQLTLQRDMADDLEALLEDSDDNKKRLARMAFLVRALIDTFQVLTSQDSSESTESSGGPEQPVKPKDAGDVSQPETNPKQSEG